MARETKSVQVYPNDYEVNQKCKREEMFGWEVIGNQSVQQFKGSDPDGTQHYESYVKLTFSRDKSAPWYAEVAELEKEYNHLESTYNSVSDAEPKEYRIWVTCVVAALGCFTGLALSQFGIKVGMYAFVPTLVYTVYRLRKTFAYKKEFAEWLESRKAIVGIPERKQAIEERCNELING